MLWRPRVLYSMVCIFSPRKTWCDLKTPQISIQREDMYQKVFGYNIWRPDPESCFVDGRNFVQMPEITWDWLVFYSSTRNELSVWVGQRYVLYLRRDLKRDYLLEMLTFSALGWRFGSTRIGPEEKENSSKIEKSQSRIWLGKNYHWINLYHSIKS
jgi:hypothetical protein